MAADDDLVSYWNDIHPPRPQFDVPTAFGCDDPPTPPKKVLPFCYRCGLPTRICNGHA